MFIHTCAHQRAHVPSIVVVIKTEFQCCYTLTFYASASGYIVLYVIFGASLSEPHTSESNRDFLCIIGASLSEPHTSGTALRTCVCMFACLLACGHTP